MPLVTIGTCVLVLMWGSVVFGFSIACVAVYTVIADF